MRKVIWIFGLLLWPTIASAQFTLVSGTVTDSNGVAYEAMT